MLLLLLYIHTGKSKQYLARENDVTAPLGPGLTAGLTRRSLSRGEEREKTKDEQHHAQQRIYRQRHIYVGRRDACV